METINILAISKKGKSRIGTKLTMVGLFQRTHCLLLSIVAAVPTTAPSKLLFLCSQSANDQPSFRHAHLLCHC